jgi:hypothetical protein
VLTIVIAEILQERFELAPELFGALTVFAPVNTLLPGLILRMPPPEYDAPEIRATLTACARAKQPKARRRARDDAVRRAHSMTEFSHLCARTA